MKFAVALCLFACVAVSHAAFSGSLVQQSQPLINQAIFKIRLATVSRSSAGAQLQTDVVEALQVHLQGLVAQVQAGVALAQGVYENIQAQFAETQAHLVSLAGGVTSQVTDIVSSLLENLNSIWGSIFGKAASKGLFDSISGAWASLTSGNWNIANIIAKIKELINTHIGALTATDAAHQVLLQLGVPSFIAQWVVGHLDNLLASDRGLFDTIWGHLSGLSAQLVAQVQAIATSIVASGQSSIAQIQLLAQQFVDAAQTEAGQITGAAAQQLLEFLAPYQQDLGALWTQIQAQVGGIVGAIGN